ncbi:hypothetical protein [Flavobacterium aquidurense]|uniref:hypothetical protein n=1 Tax=Flavobacterium aquidurense TaxID=362413 RepID=UPI00285E4EDD|nr:hypothetical protein [Flavobacterium aquidurense]MDR7371016.1 hypothetical protein [Flavobacterium aquidurense]
MSEYIRVKGNIYEKTGGVSKVFAKEGIEHNSNGKIEYFAESYSYGEPEKPPVRENKITFSGWWSQDYEGLRNLQEDTRGRKSSLGKTVYFQLTVSDNIPLGTPIVFQLWDYDTGMFIDCLNPDDDKFNGKKVYRTAVVREVEGKHRITIELYLKPEWNPDLIADKGPAKDACLDFYWNWEYNGEPWTSEPNYLSVYPSETTLFIKPAINDNRYGLPEIYSNTGATILYALEKTPNGTVKKFSMVKLRTITTFKFQADINKFKREIYEEAINLGTNRLESASYVVEEGASFFKAPKNSSQIYIDEQIINIPIEARGLLAVRNFGVKTLKFAKEAAHYYGQYEILKEMKEMIPELSSNEKFNMPSLSTFVGFIPQLEVVAFGVEVVGWMVAESLRESKEIVDESMWADWQNAKGKGLRYAQDFMRSSWARDHKFNSMYIGQSILDNVLKGKFKTLTELRNQNDNDRCNKNHTLIHYKINDETTDKIFDIIDSIYINEQEY